MVDPILAFWTLVWLAICPYGVYLLKTEDKKAASFYLYGKSLDVNKKKGLFWRIYLIPKKCFAHFYVTATLLFVTSLAISTTYYVPSSKIHQLLVNKQNGFLNNVAQLVKQYQIRLETFDSIESITALLFTLILMSIQSVRRLYESLFISVYSQTSKINLLHYGFGHAFYIMASISTLLPILLSQTSTKYTPNDLLDNLITKSRAIAFVLFVYISHLQHNCHTKLANLRKDKRGQIITEQHFVPTGDLFEYVTCPHFLTEVIIYFIIVAIQQFASSYWNMILVLVASTQTINALNEHRWYQRKYKDYPKEKRAIFPKLL